jgi:hypothetical protein
VCRDSWVGNKNVSNRTRLNRNGRLLLWRPFLLFTRSVPRPFQTYPHRCEVGRYRPRPSRAPTSTCAAIENIQANFFRYVFKTRPHRLVAGSIASHNSNPTTGPVKASDESASLFIEFVLFVLECACGNIKVTVNRALQSDERVRSKLLHLTDECARLTAKECDPVSTFRTR